MKQTFTRFMDLRKALIAIITILLSLSAYLPAFAQGSGNDYIYMTEGNGPIEYIWRGNRDGTFSICPKQVQSSSSFLLGVGNWAGEGSFFIDLNNDGTSDYVRCYEALNYIDAYINDGTGVFSHVISPISNPTGQFGGYDNTEIDGFGDANGDGYLDYINVNDDVNPNVSIHLNTSSTTAGTFASAAISFNLEVAPGAGYSVSGRTASAWSYFADLNNDGKIDFISMTGQTIYVWLGSGSGSTFRFGTLNANGRYDPNQTQTAPTGYVWTGEGTDRAAFLADVNADGNVDYVFGLAGAGYGVFFYPGLGNGRFTIPTGTPTRFALTVPAGLGAGNMAGNYAQEGTFLKDVNGDGKVDWVFMKDDAGASSGIYVWLGTGNGAAPFATSPAVTLTQSFTTASGYIDGQIGRLANILTTPYTFNVPLAPGGVGKGLSMWVRADSLGGAMTDGAPVSLWKNKAQNFDVTQSVASNQPTYKVNQINYNPAVVFNGVNDNVNGSWMNFADQQDIRSAFWMARDLATDQDYDQLLYGDDVNNGSGVFFHSGAGYLQWNGAGVAGTNIWHKDGQTSNWNTNYDFGPSGKPNLISVVDSTECIKAANIGLQAPYPTRKWNGPISEIMLYNRALTPLERQRVESYMALKYGATLDQTTGQNYLASDATVIWSATSNTSYKNNITGIGRDDASGLIQRQSRSINTTNYANITYMGLGTIAVNNQANTNSFSTNKSFLIWSDDGASVTPIATTVTGDGTTTIPTPACGAFKRMGRTWRVSKTGTVGAVEVKFALGSSLSMGTSVSDFYLAVNSTSAFSGTITKLYTPTSFVGNTVTFDNVNFSDGQYFTLIGKKSYAPGNVTAGLKFWLKADDGITFNGVSNTVSQWNDQSATNNFVAQASAGNQPVFSASKFNFNPSVSFTGAQMMLMNLTLPNTDFKLFCAGMPYNSGTWNTLFRNTVSKGDHHLIIYPSTPYMEYYDQNYGFRNSNMIVSYTAPSIMDMLYTTATSSAIPRLNGKVGTTLSPITYTAGTNDLYQHFGSLSYAQPFGNVGEVIVYNGALIPTDVQKIESYLAIKWGISVDQTTPTNYLASDGSIFWNATTNGTFKYHVTGVGRDDCSGLLQKQSSNSDTTGKGNIVTMGLDTIATDNFLNNGLVAADKNFLMWADNNVAISPPVNSAVTGDGTISLALPCGNYLQLPRTWRVQKTGTFGLVQVKIDLTGVNMGKTASDFYLAINSSATMSATITKLYAPASYVNNVLTFNNVNLSDGQYFTVLGKKVQAPGNITAGLKLWIKADYGITTSGTTVTQWADQGPQNLNLISQGWALPGYVSVGQNFNPIVTFNGGQGIGINPGMLHTNAYTGATVFAMAKPNGMSSESMFQEGLGAGGQFAAYLPYSSQFLWDGPSNDRVAVALPATVVNTPSLWTLYSNTGSQIIYQNDTVKATGTVANDNYTGNNSQLGIGVHPGVAYWSGNMSELIVYTQPLTTTQQQIINSYMALKWGISLKENLAYNYLASDSTVFWSASANGAFKNHITGIGRDDCSELMQNQSQNADTSGSGNIITIGSGKIAISNILDSNTILNNKSFLMWADNNAPLNPILTAITGDGTTTLTTSCGNYKQLGRTWRVQKTGNPVNYVQMQVNMTGVQLGKRASDFYLAVNSSSTMSGTITKLYKASSFANNIVTFDSIAFSDGQYFTVVGRRVYGPAGVTSNILLWLNGEDGITLNGSTVSEWDDISGNLNNMLQPTAANQPVYNSSSSLINFNPGLTFDGSNDFLSKTTGILGTSTYTGASVFAMTRSNAVQNQSSFCEMGTAGQFNMHDPWGDGNIYWDAGCGCGNYRLNTAWGGTTGMPYLWTLTYATTPSQSQAIYRNGLTIATDATATSYTGNNQPMAIGAYNNGGAYSLNGQIGELIMYGQSLNATQTQQVNSYMALKYGVTLDQTTATNYLASDGSSFWTASTNGAYKYRITGLGRDDCSDLIQRVSRNLDTSNLAYVTMGLGTITTSNAADSNNNISTDKNFMMWADNNASATPIASAITGDGTTTLSAACGTYKQCGRTWRIQKTGTGVGAVQVQINLNGVNLGNNASDFYLAVNSSATFSGTIIKLIPAASYTGNVVTFNNVTFTDGQYFTIVGAKLFGPGNVTSNIALWLRADTGVVLTGSNVSQWNDLSNSGNNVSQATTLSQPAYNTSNLINFNPSISFDGSSDVLTKTGGILGTATFNGSALFVISDPTTLASGRPIWQPNASGYLSLEAPWSNNYSYYDYGPSTIYAPSGTSAGAVNMFAGNSTNSPSNSQLIKVNGKTITTGTGATPFTGNNSDLGIGARPTNSEFFNGLIPEVIAYTGGLSNTDLQKVQSYLALKYGLTLDQTTAYNYIASDGTIFWNATSNGAFKYRVTGIGRDDCSALLQKQSRNQDTSSAGYVTMALNALATSNQANISTIANNKNFLMWSDNNVSPTPVSSAVTTDGTTTLSTTCGLYKQLGKTYRTSATGSVGSVQVIFNLTGISKMGRTASDFYLAINSSSTFGSTVTQLVPAASYANNTVTFNNVTFTDGQYFTILGHKNYGPGNVSSGILEWLKADDAVTTVGTNVTEWDDQSGNFGDVTQATVANQPTLNSTTNLINFNPAVTFNGSNSYMSKAAGIFGTATYSGASVFALSRTNAVQNQSLLFESTTAGQFNFHDPWGDGNIYWDAGCCGVNRLAAPWGGTVGVPYLWTLTYANSPSQSQAIYRNGLSIASDATATTYAGNGSTFYLGGGPPINPYNGQLGELIIYGQSLNNTQVQQVNSYLAIKWGLSLSQATATNYLASDTSVIWNATNNSTYKNRITGIGRDDCSELLQLQSQNQDTTSPGYVTMGLGAITTTNAANTGTFLTDKSFELWGDDGLAGIAASSVTGDGTTTLSAGCRQYRRMAKTFKVAEKGIVGNLQVKVNMKGLSALGKVASDFYLAINASATFSGTITQLIAPTSYINGVLTFDNVDFTDGQYFTVIGGRAFGPGGVSSGIALWLNPEDGITQNGAGIAEWDDISGNGYNAYQSNTTIQPTINTTSNLLNFNPSVGFNGTNQYMSLANNIVFDSLTLFSLSSPNVDGRISMSAKTSSSTNTWELWPGDFRYLEYNGTAYNTYGPALTLSQPYLATVTTYPGAGNSLLRSNGLAGTATNIPTNVPAPGSPIYLGLRAQFLDLYFSGYFGEQVLYNRILNATDINKVQSYMALKYGITLDQTMATNYLASDASVFWSAAANGAYKYRITGIGRDDCSDLIQRISRNQDTTNLAYVTMGLGTITTSNASDSNNNISTDKNFMMWADNNASAAPIASAITGDGTTTLTTCGTYKQCGRTWRIQKTGTGVGAVQIQINLNGIYLGNNASDFYLAINSSATFSGTITKLVPAASYSGNIVTFNNVSFTDGQYFTILGQKNYGPANVTTGILEWLRADAAVVTTGTNVTEWDDQSGNLGNVTQATPANQPTCNTAANLLNFNPVLSFNGTSSALNKTGGILGTSTYPGAAAFAVEKSNAVQIGGLFYEATTAWQFDAVTPWVDGNVYWDCGAASGTARLYTPWGGSVNTPYLWSFNYATTPSQTQSIYRNGLGIVSDATAASFTGNNSTFNVGEYGTTAFFNGQIGELILYGQGLSAIQRQLINSYLAIKWGISLDQSTATNYLASDSSVIWNATTNSTYKNRITGIGRDDCSQLLQLQSQNQDTTSPGYVTMGVSTIAASNATNTGTILTDKSFDLWGDDGGTGITTSTVTGDGTTTLSTNSCRLYRRMVKTYKVAEKGSVGSLQVNVNIKGLSALGKVATDFYLAINTSATFSGTITQLIQASSYSNGVLTFNNVNFADGQYFTVIGQRAQGPDNITGGLKLWLKAEDGITLNGGTVAEWDDQGPFGNNLLQATAANQPTFNSSSTNLINYNPSLTFNGTSNYLSKTGGILGTSTYAGSEVFVVSQAAAIQTSAVFGESTSTSTLDALIPWGDGNVYWDAGLTSGAGRLNTPWGGVLNKPYLWTMTYATSPSQSQAIYRNGKSIASDASAVSYTGNNSSLFVGSYVGPGSYFNGTIGEMLIYSQSLTAIQTQQINSYLALKYGFSLDQTTATNYLASDSSLIFWNATANGAYKYRITGIGRDDCSDLMQHQSHNVDSVAKGNIVAIGLNAIAATDAANTGTIASDKSFLMWADNNDNGNNFIDEISTGVPVEQIKRIDRVWRVQETGTFGPLEVKFDLNGVTQSGTTATDFTLLVSSNGNFATSTVAQYSAISYTAGVVTIDGVSLSDGQYFTLATKGCNSIPIQLTPTNTTVTASAECPESNGWTYYYDITNPTRLVFAIQHDPLNGGNNNFKATAVITTTPAANTLDRTNTSTVQGNFLMPRYWNVNIVGSMPDPVNVKFYYDPTELSATQTRATAWQSLMSASNISGPLWFKTQGHDFSAADVTPTNVNTRIGLTPIAGTEQGINYVEFDGITSFSGGTVAIRVSNINAELPVVLSSFDVADEECNAIVKWRTETEINSREFIIETTTDGYNWTETKHVAAAGNSSAAINYSINDGPVSGLEYFRLKMIDADGSFKYSPIVSLQTSCSEEVGFIAFPNPANNNLFIQFSSMLVEDATVRVINPLGQIELATAISNTSRDNTNEINVSGLPDGVHYLCVTINGKTTTKTIVKISK